MSMGKFDGYLLLSDFDSTLAHTEVYEENGERKARKAISRENCEAIRYFQSEGGLFTLATGRQLAWVGDWKESFVPNTYISCLNGAHLCSPDGKEVVFSRPMDADFVDLANRIRAACPDLEWVTFSYLGGTYRVLRGEPITAALFEGRPIYKMVFYAHRAQSDEYAARVAELVGERYLSMRSWINGIEVQLRGTGKGDTVRRLKEILGARARITVAVGDYENDIDMVRAADIGYAVANAVPQLRAVADRVTVADKESAIAAIIADLEADAARKV
ncbi:MAG: HAD-IIB family hydrolase [Ruminococcaceae bacterium]|nr:HAD-IIB family hydrolase [Oscillospiraceae bacterium]